MNSARKLRRFSAALLTCVFLSASLPGLAASTTLRLGSRGTAVLQLQQALNALGYDTNGADGKFGKGTERAVKAYQQANGLTARRQSRGQDAGAALLRQQRQRKYERDRLFRNLHCQEPQYASVRGQRQQGHSAAKRAEAAGLLYGRRGRQVWKRHQKGRYAVSTGQRSDRRWSGGHADPEAALFSGGQRCFGRLFFVRLVLLRHFFRHIRLYPHPAQGLHRGRRDRRSAEAERTGLLLRQCGRRLRHRFHRRREEISAAERAYCGRAGRFPYLHGADVRLDRQLVKQRFRQFKLFVRFHVRPGLCRGHAELRLFRHGGEKNAAGAEGAGLQCQRRRLLWRTDPDGDHAVPEAQRVLRRTALPEAPH